MRGLGTHKNILVWNNPIPGQHMHVPNVAHRCAVMLPSATHSHSSLCGRCEFVSPTHQTPHESFKRLPLAKRALEGVFTLKINEELTKADYNDSNWEKKKKFFFLLISVGSSPKSFPLCELNLTKPNLHTVGSLRNCPPIVHSYNA